MPRWSNLMTGVISRRWMVWGLLAVFAFSLLASLDVAQGASITGANTNVSAPDRLQQLLFDKNANPGTATRSLDLPGIRPYSFTPHRNQVACDIEVPASDTVALVNAINTANANETADTICLGGGTYPLTSAYYTDTTGGTGLPDITSDITILGNGATITRSSSYKFRIFKVAPAGWLTLENVTLSNGALDGYTYPGGAVFSQGCLTVQQVLFSNNQTYTGLGGAIYLEGSNSHLTVLNSSFINNRTTLSNGGAIAGGASIIIRDSLFENNAAPNTFYDGKGGALMTSALTEITGSIFRNNTGRSAGAISSTDENITIRDSLFEGNTATRGTAALQTFGNTAIVTNSRFLNNSALPVPSITTSVIGIFGTDEPHTARGVLLMSDSCIVGNSAPALYMIRPVSDARNNWWGTADGPSGAGSGHGDDVYETNAPFEPFLTAPPDGCPVLLPIATDQTVQVLYESPKLITLSAVGGLPPYTFSTTQPAHGTVSSGGGGEVVYTPDAGFSGPDSFTFTVSDEGGSVTRTITLNVGSDLQPTNQTLYLPYETPLI